MKSGDRFNGLQISSKGLGWEPQADPTLGMETTNRKEGVNMEKSNIFD
jgi:hypothetical protein